MTRRVVRIKKRTLDRVIDRDQKILACRGVYSAITTANYFGVTRKTIYLKWKAGNETNEEPPNIKTDTRDKESMYADAIILLDRGMGVVETAENLGTSASVLTRLLRTRPTGRELLWRHQAAVRAWKRGKNDPQGSYGPNWQGDEDRSYSWANKI